MTMHRRLSPPEFTEGQILYIRYRSFKLIAIVYYKAK